MTQDRGWSLERPTMWLEGWSFESAEHPGRVWGLKIEFNHVTNDEVIHAYVVNPNKNSGHCSSVDVSFYRIITLEEVMNL